MDLKGEIAALPGLVTVADFKTTMINDQTVIEIRSFTLGSTSTQLLNIEQSLTLDKPNDDLGEIKPFMRSKLAN